MNYSEGHVLEKLPLQFWHALVRVIQLNCELNSDIMAFSERLQMQKIRATSGNYEPEFALVLYEDEEKYSVVERNRIQETHYALNQTVHVLWGVGKSASHFPAKLITLELEVQEKIRPSKRKGKDEHNNKVPLKKSKESSKSASASWQVGLEEEQKKLKQAVGLNSQRDLLRCFTGSAKHDTCSDPLQHDLSSIVGRLDSIEGKLYALLKQPCMCQTKPRPTSATTSPPVSRPVSPFTSKERNDTKGLLETTCSVSDNEGAEESEMIYNGTDLLSLKAPPRGPTRYATRLAGVLFSKEELMNGMIPPLNEYPREPLDPRRIAMMRNCIVQKYTAKVVNKNWAEIRRAVNQKCNDIRKKNVADSGNARDGQ